MPFLILLALIIVPVIEIALFIRVGEAIDLWPTLGLVIATAVLGSWLLRRQGLKTLTRARENLNRGELPVAELFDGFCIVIGGALLLTPGFLTDTIGFLLLIPALRTVLRGYLGARMAHRVHVQGDPRGTGSTGPGSSRQGPGPTRGGPTTIDGDYVAVDPDENRPSDGDDDHDPDGLPEDSRWGRR